MKLKKALNGTPLGDILDAANRITKIAEFEAVEQNSITLTHEINNIVRALNTINRDREVEENNARANP